jgi:hypothetical protein
MSWMVSTSGAPYLALFKVPSQHSPEDWENPRTFSVSTSTTSKFAGTQTRLSPEHKSGAPTLHRRRICLEAPHKKKANPDSGPRIESGTP